MEGQPCRARLAKVTQKPKEQEAKPLLNRGADYWLPGFAPACGAQNVYDAYWGPLFSDACQGVKGGPLSREPA